MTNPADYLLPGILYRRDAGEPAAPVVFDSPHSGSDYPGDFDFEPPIEILRDTEDAYVDELFGAAPECGGALLAALFPRSYIDPNRAPLDIDPALLTGPWPEDLEPSEKTRLGLGLIRSAVRAGRPVYGRKLSVAEVKARIDTYYWPYHRELAALIDDSHRRFGAAWHVNCHSMQAFGSSMTPDGKGAVRADFCLGDRDGTTCDGEFIGFVGETLSAMGYSVTVNAPLKGVELVRLHGDPPNRRHSLQIEINRGIYMDERTRQKVPGFGKLRADISKLVAAICEFARRKTDGAP